MEDVHVYSQDILELEIRVFQHFSPRHMHTHKRFLENLWFFTEREKHVEVSWKIKKGFC
jgi:hypothetical protein